MNKVFFIPVWVLCVTVWVLEKTMLCIDLYVLCIKHVRVGMHTLIASQCTAPHWPAAATPGRQGKGQIHHCHETHQIRLSLTTEERLWPMLRGLPWLELGWAELVSAPPIGPVASPAWVWALTVLLWESSETLFPYLLSERVCGVVEPVKAVGPPLDSAVHSQRESISSDKF